MTNNRRLKPRCIVCEDMYATKRAKAGYHTCMPCGDAQAQKTRHTIVPMSKSNYIVVTDLSILKGLNKYANS